MTRDISHRVFLRGHQLSYMHGYSRSPSFVGGVGGSGEAGEVAEERAWREQRRRKMKGTIRRKRAPRSISRCVDNRAGCGGLGVMGSIWKLLVRRREMEMDGLWVLEGGRKEGRKDCGSGYEADPRFTSDIGYID
jgi:hypothetical protein